MMDVPGLLAQFEENYWNEPRDLDRFSREDHDYSLFNILHPSGTGKRLFARSVLGIRGALPHTLIQWSRRDGFIGTLRIDNYAMLSFTPSGAALWIQAEDGPLMLWSFDEDSERFEQCMALPSGLADSSNRPSTFLFGLQLPSPEQPVGIGSFQMGPMEGIRYILLDSSNEEVEPALTIDFNEKRDFVANLTRQHCVLTCHGREFAVLSREEFLAGSLPRSMREMSSTHLPWNDMLIGVDEEGLWTITSDGELNLRPLS